MGQCSFFSLAHKAASYVNREDRMKDPWQGPTRFHFRLPMYLMRGTIFDNMHSRTSTKREPWLQNQQERVSSVSFSMNRLNWQKFNIIIIRQIDRRARQEKTPSGYHLPQGKKEMGINKYENKKYEDANRTSIGHKLI